MPACGSVRVRARAPPRATRHCSRTQVSQQCSGFVRLLGCGLADVCCVYFLKRVRFVLVLLVLSHAVARACVNASQLAQKISRGRGPMQYLTFGLSRNLTTHGGDRTSPEPL